MSPLRFSFLFFGYALCIGLAAGFLSSVSVTQILVPKFWVLFGTLAVFTLVAYTVSWIGIKRSPESSVYTTLGAMMVKLLLSMLFALFYLLKININNVIFVIDFISIYFLFSAFEIWALLTNLRHQNKSE